MTTINKALDWERSQEERYEFDGTEFHKKEGDTGLKNLMIGRLRELITPQIRINNGYVFASSIKVLLPFNQFYYPDLIVTHEIGSLDNDYVETASLIVEILTDKTNYWEQYKRIKQYQQLTSLYYLLLVKNNEPYVQLFQREDRLSPRWRPITEYKNREDIIRLPLIGAELVLDNLYSVPDTPKG